MPSCNVLQQYDPMISLDVHDCLFPPAVPAPVPTLYAHVATLAYGILAEKSKYTGGPSYRTKGPVKTGGQYAMLQGTCCGYLNPHIGNPANVLLPLIMLFSSSKSLFVSGKTKFNGANVACALFVYSNVNLNCADPVSMPTGAVFAFNTVQAGMTLGDIAAGFISGAIQMAIEYGLGKGQKAGGKFISKQLYTRTIVVEGAEKGVVMLASNDFMKKLIQKGLYKTVNDTASKLAGAGVGILLDNFDIKDKDKNVQIPPLEDVINLKSYDWVGSDDSDDLRPDQYGRMLI